MHKNENVNEIVLLDQSQDILCPLVHSGFLSLKDIGRLLIRTSKSITEYIYNDDSDDLWKYLLKQRFYFEEEALLESKIPAKNIFMSTFQKMSERPPMQIRDLRYSPQDYLIILDFHMRIMMGSLSSPKLFPGKTSQSFWSEGLSLWKIFRLIFI